MVLAIYAQPRPNIHYSFDDFPNSIVGRSLTVISANNQVTSSGRSNIKMEFVTLH